jgi:hypothetical protein
MAIHALKAGRPVDVGITQANLQGLPTMTFEAGLILNHIADADMAV